MGGTGKRRRGESIESVDIDQRDYRADLETDGAQTMQQKSDKLIRQTRELADKKGKGKARPKGKKVTKPSYVATIEWPAHFRDLERTFKVWQIYQGERLMG